MAWEIYGCAMCSDAVTWIVTFIVSLFADVVPGLIAGIITSWFLSMTLPYHEVPILRTLKQRLSGNDSVDGTAHEGSANADTELAVGPTDLIDGLAVVDPALLASGDVHAALAGSDSANYRTSVALLKFKLAIVFSNATKVQVLRLTTKLPGAVHGLACCPDTRPSLSTAAGITGNSGP